MNKKEIVQKISEEYIITQKGIRKDFSPLNKEEMLKKLNYYTRETDKFIGEFIS